LRSGRPTSSPENSVPDQVIEQVLPSDLVPGPHPDEPGTWLVLNPQSGDVFEFSDLVWAVASALDGQRTARQVAEHADALISQVQEVLKVLAELGLLVAPPATPTSPRASVPPPQWTRGPVPEDFDLWVHPDASFECIGAGSCCERSYVIPVRSEQVQGLRAAAARRPNAERDPVTVWPGEKGQPWGYVLDNDEGCVFHDQAQGCAIHEQACQPDACQVFPLVFARVGQAVVASLSHRCGCGALGHGPALDGNVQEVLRRLGRTPHIPAVPEVATLDACHTIDGSAAADVMRQVALHEWPLDDPSTPWSMLFAVLAGLTDCADKQCTLPQAEGPQSLEGLRERLQVGAASDLMAALAFEPTVDVAALKVRLQQAGIEDVPEGTGELSRFLRDHLYGLRPFQQATLTQGLALLAVMLQGLCGATGGAMTMRARIMAWDDVIPQTDMRGALAFSASPLTEDVHSLTEVVLTQQSGK